MAHFERKAGDRPSYSHVSIRYYSKPNSSRIASRAPPAVAVSTNLFEVLRYNFKST